MVICGIFIFWPDRPCWFFTSGLDTFPSRRSYCAHFSFDFVFCSVTPLHAAEKTSAQVSQVGAYIRGTLVGYCRQSPYAYLGNIVLRLINTFTIFHFDRREKS